MMPMTQHSELRLLCSKSVSCEHDAMAVFDELDLPDLEKWGSLDGEGFCGDSISLRILLQTAC